MGNDREKIFCIGLNKTGTTSLGFFFELQGFKVLNQRIGELMLLQYLKRDFENIAEQCSSSGCDVFQDVPFSLPDTFEYLAERFPESKFILTVRDSAEVWYQSMLQFHSDFFNKGRLPTRESLEGSSYIYKGWAWDMMNSVYFKGKDKLYNKADLESVYSSHNQRVIDYFKEEPGRLLVMNLSKKEDFPRLCNFIGITSEYTEFPRITSKDIASGSYTCKFLMDPQQ